MHLIIDGKAAWFAAIAIALGLGLPGCASITSGTTPSVGVASIGIPAPMVAVPPDPTFTSSSAEGSPARPRP